MSYDKLEESSFDNLELCSEAITALEEEMNDLLEYETSNEYVTMLIIYRLEELDEEIEKMKSAMEQLVAA